MPVSSKNLPSVASLAPIFSYSPKLSFIAKYLSTFSAHISQGIAENVKTQQRFSKKIFGILLAYSRKIELLPQNSTKKHVF